ncbi:hypothetical protein [Chryseobacterium viscerum]|uniref:DUF1360 domain-containing protein n=1 Tax=Chryseobacterium viscerum TaxID=1037377 RepID=A0A5N4BJ27_9FLAO|nr:hypothetical protein [Chryseobacterium viscerum]KAB1228444.1 hypothetical protein F8D52_22475 [Chryseobacterium viscerum]
MFIGITILFILGNASLAFILFMSIQKDQWIDKLFKWQSMLRNFDVKGTPSGMAAYKILGGCELCFAHLISFMGYWVYLLLMFILKMDYAHWFVLVIWYFIYVPLTTNISLYFIKKLYQNGGNNRGNNASNLN